MAPAAYLGAMWRTGLDRASAFDERLGMVLMACAGVWFGGGLWWRDAEQGLSKGKGLVWLGEGNYLPGW